MKINYALLVLFFAFFYSTTGFSQDLLKTRDLSAVKVETLTDEEVSKVKAQLETNKISLEQLEVIAISRGMTLHDFNKLKNRLESTSLPKEAKIEPKKNKNLEDEDESDEDEDLRDQEKIKNKKVKDSTNALVFGSDLFDRPDLNFEPSLKLATPVNYILGPGDELQINVFGVQEFNSKAIVSPEGKITIQYVGQIAVSGTTIEAATQKIKNEVSKIYSTVRIGQSQVSVSLSRIRTIKVTIIGAKLPGNFSVSSLSTVFNALFLAGGPGINGSYRNIELLRNNKIYKKIDIYNFLVKGDQSDNIGLKDNDVIRIPAYSNRVTLNGEVKRPGIFELKPNETFENLLEFASGFNEFAYTAAISVIQKTGKDFRVKNIQSTEFKVYKPQFGDLIKVEKILDRFENRITIEGAVFRPSSYSFYQGMKVKDLVGQADGLTEDAYLDRATIIRTKPDLTKEVAHVNLRRAILGEDDQNIALRKDDIVKVYSILDFREEMKVTIDGEVNEPGDYEYYENLTLNDLLVQAGGLKGSASKRVEIARMIKSDDASDGKSKRVELFNLDIIAGNNEQIKNFNLAAFDVVNIRRMPVYDKPELITVSGAVNYTGKYVLVNKKEKIYDIILRAGGLKENANIDGVKIKRPIQEKQIEDIKNVKLVLEKKDSLAEKKFTKKLSEDVKYAIIPVDWRKIVKDPNDRTNVTLFPGDEIDVSVMNENVKITGSVLLTSEIPYSKRKGFNYYLGSVGGAAGVGWKRKAFIIYPNGKAAISSGFLLFRTYPKVLPGSQIVVPEKPTGKRLSTGEIVSLASVMASLAGIVVGILSLN